MGFKSAEGIYIPIYIARYFLSRILVTSNHFSTSFPLSQIIVFEVSIHCLLQIFREI